MDTTGPSPTNTMPPPPPPPVRRLRRSRSERVLGGVCGGLGRHLGVDPVLVRIGVVVLAVMGGAGVAAYVAAWILMPDEDDAAAAPAAPWSWGRLAAAVVVGVLVAAALGDLARGRHTDLGLALVLVAGGLAVLWARRDAPGGRGGSGGGAGPARPGPSAGGPEGAVPWSPPPPNAAPAGPAASAPPAPPAPGAPPGWDGPPGPAPGARAIDRPGPGDDPALPAARAPRALGAGPDAPTGASDDGPGAPTDATRPLGAADPAPPPSGPGAWGAVAPPPTTPVATRTSDRRTGRRTAVRVVGGLVVLAALVELAVVAALDWTRITETLPAWWSLALLGLAAGASVVALARSAPARGATAVALGVTVAAGVLVAVQTDPRGGFGELVRRPEQVGAAGIRVQHAAGRTLLELDRLVLAPGQRVPVEVDNGAGRVRITVPADATVEVRAGVRAGQLQLLGRVVEGWDVSADAYEPGRAGAPVVSIDARLGVGLLVVERAG